MRFSTDMKGKVNFSRNGLRYTVVQYYELIFTVVVAHVEVLPFSVVQHYELLLTVHVAQVEL